MEILALVEWSMKDTKLIINKVFIKGGFFEEAAFNFFYSNKSFNKTISS